MITELNYIELKEISGGSAESYKNGEKAGKAVRKFTDDFGAVLTIASVILCIATRGASPIV